MYDNYTIELLNPDKISTRQAEAEAQRRAAEGRVPSKRTFRAPAGIGRIVTFGASPITAVRRWAGQTGPDQPLRGPRHAAGQPRTLSRSSRAQPGRRPRLRARRRVGAPAAGVVRRRAV